jgi:tripartite-type tricarboxylate transporter receptor subunit TctC
MGRQLGQPVVVVNRPGAGGALGAAQVAAARPDGYTLLVALSSISTNPEQEVINNRPAAFQLNQLTPIARISKEDMMLAVRADSRYRSFADVIADAKTRPGAVSYASSGVYGVYHVATEMLADAAGISLLHAPYNGGAPALMALLGGQVDFGLVTRSVGAAQLKAGKLRALAAWGDSRWPDYPELPSLKELGYFVDYTLWSGMFAPAGTPPEVLQVLRSAVKSALEDAEFRDAMARLGAPLVYQDAPEFQRYWDADAERLIRAIRKIGRLQ